VQWEHLYVLSIYLDLPLSSPADVPLTDPLSYQRKTELRLSVDANRKLSREVKGPMPWERHGNNVYDKVVHCFEVIKEETKIIDISN
jgi:hypothetical protein